MPAQPGDPCIDVPLGCVSQATDMHANPSHTEKTLRQRTSGAEQLACTPLMYQIRYYATWWEERIRTVMSRNIHAIYSSARSDTEHLPKSMDFESVDMINPNSHTTFQKGSDQPPLTKVILDGSKTGPCCEHHV